MKFLTANFYFKDSTTLIVLSDEGIYNNKTNDIRIRCDEIDKLIIKRMKGLLSESQAFEDLISKAQKKKTSTLPAVNKRIREIRSSLEEVNNMESDLQEGLLDPEKRRNKVFMDFLENLQIFECVAN